MRTTTYADRRKPIRGDRWICAWLTLGAIFWGLLARALV
jgi:hypothetical protein